MTDTCSYCYTIQDFYDISQDGFDYTISEETLDIISALASQVGAPDYVRTPNFTTYHSTKEGRANRGGRRRKPQEMDDSDWECIRTFHTKPKVEISPEKALEKKLRGELNKVASQCSMSQLESISSVMSELIDAKLGNIVERVFFDLAACSKMNTTSFAMLFSDLVSQDNDTVVELLISALDRFISDDGKWMRMFDVVEYVSEDEDYDKFCDVNKVNDLRLNTTRFVAKVFQTLFEKEDERFFWLEKLAGCYWRMFCGFKDALRNENNEDISMVYCSNIIELMQPLNDHIVELDDETGFWGNVIEDQEQIIASGERAYPSLSRQIVFAIQGAFNV